MRKCGVRVHMQTVKFVDFVTNDKILNVSSPINGYLYCFFNGSHFRCLVVLEKVNARCSPVGKRDSFFFFFIKKTCFCAV